jgi:hypothetical protein
VLRLVRIALQVVLFFLLLSVVLGLASGMTGTVENVVLVILGGVLVWIASMVRHLDHRGPAPG